jgi:hypothetical protein
MVVALNLIMLQYADFVDENFLNVLAVEIAAVVVQLE